MSEHSEWTWILRKEYHLCIFMIDYNDFMMILLQKQNTYNNKKLLLH